MRRSRSLGAGLVAVALGLGTQRLGGAGVVARLVADGLGVPRPFVGGGGLPLRLLGALAGVVGLGAGVAGLLAGARGVGRRRLGVVAGLVAFGLRRRDLGGGLRADLGELPLHTHRGQLGVQRLGQRLDDLVEPVDRLPGAGHLPGQTGGVAVPHPAVAGGPLAGAVVVAAVAKRSARADTLRDRPSTVGAGAGFGGAGLGVHRGRSLVPGGQLVARAVASRV